jgi:2-succinyl-5-enolpyruvyl-6-hydroxy-3-cyclohexene-1-carboxylate synthase
VCGGRRFTDGYGLSAYLTLLTATRGRPEVVIHGKATGADQFAGDWARSVGIPVIADPVTLAEWREYGKAAGRIRNQRMLDKHAPTLVVAFPGGPGTAHMTQIAEKAGLLVIRVNSRGGRL